MKVHQISNNIGHEIHLKFASNNMLVMTKEADFSGRAV